MSEGTSQPGADGTLAAGRGSVAATKSPVKRREIAAMRSSGLRRLLARHALAEDVRRVAGLVRTSKDPEKIAGCLPDLRALKTSA